MYCSVESFDMRLYNVGSSGITVLASNYTGEMVCGGFHA